jgi:hypothetical protein
MTEHLISRPAQLTKCRTCGRHILAAITSGLTVAVNPESLSVNAEIAARIQGRIIFDVLVHGLPRRMYLEYRDLGRVRAGRKHAVVAEHECPGPFILTGDELAVPWPRKKPGKAAIRTAARKGRDGEVMPF